jgi:hypothetical protein
MFTALYYPHTAIQDENFLKHALLYWDQIEYISPYHGFDPVRDYHNPAVREALRITKPHLPTPDEKKRAHKIILELVDGGLPTWLQVNRTSVDAEERHLYGMYRYKLLPETWNALEELRLVQSDRRGDFDDYVAHTYLGLTIMAILARCCAGTLRHTITDRDESYLALTRCIQSLDNPDGLTRGRRSRKTLSERWLNALGMAQSHVEQEIREVLLTITLDVIDTKSIPLDVLLALRNDKSKLTGELRQNYAKAIQDCVDEITEPGRTKTDMQFLIEEFRRRMQQDLARLYAELRPLGCKTVLSKEVAVAVVAPILGSTSLIASGVGPILGGAIGIGALGKLAAEYKSSRASVFQRHPMAFLYASKGARLY